jgi:hypothetical protein
MYGTYQILFAQSSQPGRRTIPSQSLGPFFGLLRGRVGGHVGQTNAALLMTARTALLILTLILILGRDLPRVLMRLTGWRHDLAIVVHFVFIIVIVCIVHEFEWIRDRTVVMVVVVVAARGRL